jgi:hypothetical protein
VPRKDPMAGHPNCHLDDPGSLRHCDHPACEAVYDAYMQDDSTVYCDFLCGAKVHPDPTSLVEVTAAFYHWRQHPVTGGCSHGS